MSTTVITTVRRNSGGRPTEEQIAERAAKVEAHSPSSCTPQSSI
jgi:hypothetical protein